MLALIAQAALAVSRSRSDVADLIEADPAGWTTDQYEAMHAASGLHVWISGEADFIKVAVGATTAQNKNAWKPCWAERRLIWRAVRRLVRRHEETRRRRAAEAVRKALDAVNGGG